MSENLSTALITRDKKDIAPLFKASYRSILKQKAIPQYERDRILTSQIKLYLPSNNEIKHDTLFHREKSF